MNKKHINQLDVFRALAALSVCSVHFTYDSFFHNYFAQGLFVQLFFTLSGFVIAYNYHENLKNLKSFFNFSIKRFKRLYPLHLFFLILFLILEIIKYILVIKFDLKSNNIPFEFNNLKNFLLNIFFIQHFATEYNFNSPSWSISVEMMLYFTFCLLLLIFKNKFFLVGLYLAYVIYFYCFLNSHYGETLSIFAFYSGLYSFSIGCLFFYYIKKLTVYLNQNIFGCIFYILLRYFIGSFLFQLNRAKEFLFYYIRINFFLFMFFK